MTETPITTPTSEQLHAKLQALLNGPARTPPVGVTSNFNDPPNLDFFVILTMTLCVTFATLAVLMRMYTKLFIIRSTAYEDYAVVIAWIGQIGETIPSGLMVRNGGGIHMWDIQLKTFFRLLYYSNMMTIVYCPVVFFIKLSILLQYLRIFVPTRKGNLFMFVGVYLCIWICLIFYLFATIFGIFMCKPREKLWNPLLTTGHCFNPFTSFQAIGTFNILSDMAILILPMSSIWRIQMPRKKKILMIAIFAAGFFGCVTSTVRTYYSWMIIKSPDLSYNMTRAGLWTYAEIAIGIIVSCLPVSPRFFRHFGPKVYRTFSFGTKSGITFGSKPDIKGVGDFFKGPFTRRSGGTRNSVIAKDPRNPQAQLEGAYITLDDYDLTSPKWALTTDSMRMPSEGPTTKRNDLENGQSGVEVVRTVCWQVEDSRVEGSLHIG